MSDFPAAKEARTAAREALEPLVRAACSEPARSLAGVRVKAKAMCAWGRVDSWSRVFTMDAWD